MLTLVYYCLAIFLFLFVTEAIVTETAILFINPKIKFPLYTLLEYSFFSAMIYQQLKTKKLKWIIIALSIIFFLFQVVYYFTSAPSKRTIDSVPIGFETILIFIFIFFFLYEEFNDVKGLPIYENYFFWISVGLFIYLGGSFFIYLYSSTITRQELDKFWLFTYVVEIIKNILFISSIFVYSKNLKKTNGDQTLPNLDFMI